MGVYESLATPIFFINVAIEFSARKLLSPSRLDVLYPSCNIFAFCSSSFSSSKFKMRSSWDCEPEKASGSYFFSSFYAAFNVWLCFFLLYFELLCSCSSLSASGMIWNSPSCNGPDSPFFGVLFDRFGLSSSFATLSCYFCFTRMFGFDYSFLDCFMCSLIKQFIDCILKLDYILKEVLKDYNRLSRCQHSIMAIDIQ